MRSEGGRVRPGKYVLDPLHNIERRGTAGFQDTDENAPLAVAPNDIRLRREAMPDVRYIADINGGIVPTTFSGNWLISATVFGL